MPPSAGLLHLTEFIKSRWWAGNPDSRGCDGSHVSCQNWLRYHGSCLGKGRLGCARGNSQQSDYNIPDSGNPGNVSIMACEHSDGDGTRRRGKPGKGSGGWDERGKWETESDVLSQRWVLDRWASTWVSLRGNSLWSDVMSKTEERAVGQENPSTTFPQVVSWFLMFWMAFKKKKSNIFTDYVLTNKQTITQSHCSLQSSTSHLWNSNVVSQRLVVTKMDKFLKQLAAFNEKQK